MTGDAVTGDAVRDAVTGERWHAVAAAVILQRWAGHQSALNPAGPAAHEISTLWWWMLAVSTVVTLIVIAFLLYASFRARGHAQDQPDTAPIPQTERTMTRAVATGAGVTAVILFVFLCFDFVVGRAVAAPHRSPQALAIKVTGHQWWWEVQYDAPVPQQQLTTANEIHVPVGRPVLFTLLSDDVIHSFWVPNLNGKSDLIPGYEASGWFRADTPGVYRGQCAEFCGLQHGKMAFFVIAEPPAQYDAWYAQQLRGAQTPENALRSQGEKVFLAGPCSTCHAVRGTSAGGVTGPELTHIGSRSTLAAGTLQNTPDNLARWISDPQGVKPGANMPPGNLSPADLRAVVTYLEGLQ